MSSNTIGTTLRQRREARRMGLAELARITRIPLGTLDAIERDHFDDLPGEVFVRGFLRSYARAVGMVPDEMVARYMSSRRVAAVEPLPLSVPVAVASDTQSRRFGVAIALVLLLVLFTLALSIVLKPRGRDMPLELSRLPAASYRVG